MPFRLRNNLFVVFLAIILLAPTLGGRGVHLFFGCPDSHCGKTSRNESSGTAGRSACPCPHDNQDESTDETSSERHECSICGFFTLPNTTTAVFSWSPDTRPHEKTRDFFSRFLVTVYQDFANGRAPPLS